MSPASTLGAGLPFMEGRGKTVPRGTVARGLSLVGVTGPWAALVDVRR